MAEEKDTTLIELAAGIVESYVANNQVQPDHVPDMLENVYTRLDRLHRGAAAAEPTAVSGGDDRPTPPVKPQNSVRKNDVVCLECGKSYKTLKRHLRTEHGMEESDYKQRWELPAGLKLVSKDYSAKRSQMATELGLGNRRKK
jgi:predicted transcriptional regulator